MSLTDRHSPRFLAALVAAAALSLPPTAVAATDGAGLAAARALLAAGDFPAAEAACDRLLAATPGDADALLARAHARAFQRKLGGAEADFRAVLVARPDDVAARTGLGHALAWAGKLDEAERELRRALALAPGDPDAAKGLAWTALWRGDAAEAGRRFEALSHELPGSAEPQVGLGRALEAQGRTREARAAFARALALEPGREDARTGLALAGPGPARFDATLLGGATHFAGGEELGLRFAEAALSPTETTRVWLQYDDSLSLDNVGLARNDQRAPSVYLGGRVAYAARWATRLEVGWRRLPGAVDQPMVRGEQTLAVARGVELRSGAWLGPRDDGRLEAIAHAGASLPVGARLRLEPTLFWARSGVAGERELRSLLAADVRLGRGVEVGAGVAAGRTVGGPGDGVGASAFARASFPLRRGARGLLLVSRESPAAGPAITSFAFGLHVRPGGDR